MKKPTITSQNLIQRQLLQKPLEKQHTQLQVGELMQRQEEPPRQRQEGHNHLLKQLLKLLVQQQKKQHTQLLVGELMQRQEEPLRQLQVGLVMQRLNQQLWPCHGRMWQTATSVPQDRPKTS